MSDGALLLLGGHHQHPPPAPMPQLVLPACASCPRPDSYDKELTWDPPRTRDFLRADFAGVPIDGLPFVPGGSSEHPERLLTPFLYKYDRALWPRCFAAHARRGYTHWVLWYPNARADGLSLDDFASLCLHVQDAGFYTQVGLNSKDYDPADLSPAGWRDRLDPVFAFLGRSHAADEYAVWEWDSHNIPGDPTIETLKHFGRLAHDQGASLWAHFLPGHPFWDPRGRYPFWDDLGLDVDGLDYQAHPEWDIGNIQAHAVDVLDQFAAQDYLHKFRLKEIRAAIRFTHDHPTEDEVCALGYLGCCTKANAHVWGYGEGARRLDGSPL